MTDLASLRVKRGQRKGVATKMEKYLNSVNTKSLQRLMPGELQSRIKQLDDAMIAYDLIQDRIEELEEPDETAHHLDTVDSQREVMETIKEALSRKYCEVKCACDVVSLYNEVQELIRCGLLTSATTLSRVKHFNTTYMELSHSIVPYLANDVLKGQWDSLTADKVELHRQSAAATKPDATPAVIPDATATSTPTIDGKLSVVNLSHLKVKPPTFNGDPLEWSKFKSLLTSIISDAKYLSDRQKVSILIEAMTDSKAKMKVEDAAANGTFDDAMAALTETYGRPRIVFPLYMDLVFQRVQPISYTSSSLLETKSAISKAYRGLQSCKACTAEHLIGQHLFNLFTAEMWNAWAHYNAGSKDPPTYERVLAFLEKESVDLDADIRPPATSVKSKTPQTLVKPNVANYKSAKVHAVRSTEPPLKTVPCNYCKNDGHRIHSCPDFRAVDTEVRRLFVNSSRLCYNCLASGHRSQDCNSRGRCKECGSKHHTLLHSSSNHRREPSTPATSSTPPVVAKVNFACLGDPPTPTKSLLRTAVVEVSSAKGSRTASLLFDEGVEVSLITSRLARTIGAELKPCNL